MKDLRKEVMHFIVVIKNNVIYDTNKKLGADVYYPNNTTSKTKILIFWHGGCWFRGNKESVKSVGVDLANAGPIRFLRAAFLF